MPSKRNRGTDRMRAVNSFFAGIGGFDLAFERRGFKPTFYCEKDPFCRSVLKRHWPILPNAVDIRCIGASDIPNAEIWTAGFPCQDLSLARTPHGRSGLRGSQSGLFFTFVELLSVRKPEVVLLENVVGLLNSHAGADFDNLINTLADLGYAVAWRVLNARYFGTPQSRPRVFICAWANSPVKAIRALYEDQPAAIPGSERCGFEKESKCAISGISVPQVSFCISATSGRHTGLDWARSYVTYPNAVRRLTPRECERLQGLPDGWTVPSKDYVIPIRGFETNRYRAIGNAVCVPVVEWIAGRIENLMLSTPATMKIQNLAARFLSDDAEISLLRGLDGDRRWRSGGIAFNGDFATSSVSPSPIQPVPSFLIDLIEKIEVNEHYFLSTNAMRGILRRVDKLGRNLFQPLDSVLRNLTNPEVDRQGDPNSIAI